MPILRDNNLRQRKQKQKEPDNVPNFRFKSSKEDPTILLPNSVGFGLILILLILIKFFYDFENILPDQLKLGENDCYPGRFIGERAEQQLKRLTSLGTRVVGSYENEVLAVDFLKQEVLFIASEANNTYNIEVDIQKPTGSYYLAFKPHGFINYYANIQNVVVKLSSGNSTNNSKSILMNCHYDTVPESPGASDNGLNCVVMLEILRVLAKEHTPLKNNIIFLFNGAEENPLQASHGFLSQHKWSKEVKVVINLDSAGAGGKEVLFQTSGEPWLVQAYAHAVPIPTAGVQAEELFHFGIIPSDTDFRVFRDFAGYPGFDFAHCANGYIYHTKFDTMDFIKSGVYQNTGDNMLALVRELVNSSELGMTHLKTRMVYFDVFTKFMIFYTEGTGSALNLATVVLSLLTIFLTFKTFLDRILSRMLIATGSQVLSLGLAGAFVFFTANFLDCCMSTMSWYLQPWLIVPLYSFPILFALTFGLVLTQKFLKENILERKIIYLINGAQLLWTIILFVGTVRRIRTSFILMLIVLFPSIGSLFARCFKVKVKFYLIIYFCCLAFPLLFTLNQAVRIFTVIIPMTARMGPHTNPEVIIGALAFLTSTIYLSQLVPLLLLLRKLRNLLITLLFLNMIVITGIVFSKSGFPYSGNVKNPALQRFYVLHCERTFHNPKGSVRKADSGIFVQSLDRNNINYVTHFVSELLNATTAASDCETEVFCGFPTFTSRFIPLAPYSYWIPAASPTIHHPTSLEIVSQTQVTVNTRRIKLLVAGPDHITVGMSPRTGVQLVQWSFDSAPLVDLENWNKRKMYMVYYSHGLMAGTLEFEVDLEISQNHSDHMMDIAIIGHYMHDKKYQTDEFKSLLSKFPDWAHVTPWTTTYKSWVI